MSRSPPACCSTRRHARECACELSFAWGHGQSDKKGGHMRRIRVWLAVSIAIVFTSTGHAEPPPALAAYGALPAVQDPALSPSGRRIALVATLNGKRQLIAREVGGDPIAIAGVGDLKVRDVRWAGEDLLTLQV